jgi:C4-dicarboxylate-binding protein DctP
MHELMRPSLRTGARRLAQRSPSGKLLGIGAGIAATCLLAACASNSGSAAAASGSGNTVTGKFALQQAADTATGRSAVQFADLVSKYSGGTVKLTVYPDSQLGSATTMLQGTEAGTISFYASPTLDSAVPATDALETPYLFPSEAVASKVLNSTALDTSLWSQFDSHNLSYLGSWIIGFADILTANTAVNAPDNLKGLRIRVFEPVVSSKMYSDFGGTAVTLDSTQVSTGLSTHLIDGADDPPTTLVANNWYDGMHDLAITNHVLVAAPVIVSKAFMAKLSKSQQAAVERAMQETIAPNMADANKSNAAALTKMQSAGITITHPSEAAFKAATANVVGSITSLYPGVIQAIKTAVAGDSNG